MRWMRLWYVPYLWTYMVIVDVKNASFYTIRLIDWIYHLLVSPLGMKTHQDFFAVY